MAIFSSLNQQQKEAVGLLQIGTFLEYFDLMLYVHMAVLMNELFFPKTDPHTAFLLTAFAFCSTYVLRPFGALLFGWLGDNIGRKATIIVTTMMMSISCVAMAILPTYAEIGITAAWIITICRILQGISSMGERIGAEIYLMEITKPPSQYPAVAFVSVSAALGAVFALVIATLATKMGFNWRFAFWIGACIAVVGSVARTRLKETPDFITAKKHIKNSIEALRYDKLVKSAKLLKTATSKIKGKVSKKTGLCFMVMQIPWAVWFFFVYAYCSDLLKNRFGFNAGQILFHNFLVSLFQLLNVFVSCYLSRYINPLKILKVKFFALSSFILVVPHLLSQDISSSGLFAIQLVFIFFAYDMVPATPIFYKTIPIMKRFTYSTFTYAIARALAYVVTSFSVVYATEFFSYFGLWFIMIPISLMYIWALKHFEKLERERIA